MNFDALKRAGTYTDPCMISAGITDATGAAA
jgi:hypothetical protein